MLDLIPKKKFDFLGKRRLAAPRFPGIDWRIPRHLRVSRREKFRHRLPWWRSAGGRFQTALTIAEAREALEGIGLGDVVIQFEREGMQVRLSIRSPQGTSAKILSKLQETYRNRDVTAVAQENVGPQIGLEFAKRAALALGLGHGRHSHLRDLQV